MKKNNFATADNNNTKETNTMNKNSNASANNTNAKEINAMNKKNIATADNTSVKEMQNMKKNKKELTVSESRQKAFTYIIYMMVGSYFKNTVCADAEYITEAEKEYNKLTEDEQVFLENQIIRYTERQLLKGIASRIWKEGVSVHAKRNNKESQKITFLGKDFELSFLVDHADGRGAIIRTAYVDHKNKVVTGLIRTILRPRTEVWYNPAVRDAMEKHESITECPECTKMLPAGSEEMELPKAG